MIQALLLFLITPFADLTLAQVLRTPIFACSDADLMRLAEIPLAPFAKGGDRREAVSAESFIPPPWKRGGEGGFAVGGNACK